MPAAGGALNLLQTSTPPTPGIGGAGFVTGVVSVSGVDRSIGSGDNVATTFGSTVTSGNPSDIIIFIIFQTNVTQYQSNEQAVVFFGDGSTHLSDRLIFAPKGQAAAEPASLLLWCGMAGGLGVLAWRKRRGRTEWC
jgi:hypothetical protein